MTSLDLTDEQREALIRVLTAAIEADRFPLSPRVQRWKRIRAKLGGKTPETERPARKR